MLSAYLLILMNNKIIDKNLLGIPTEQYGFSNNASGFLGSPFLQ
jgi:uncharacterized protein (DUF2141 family)